MAELRGGAGAGHNIPEPGALISQMSLCSTADGHWQATAKRLRSEGLVDDAQERSTGLEGTYASPQKLRTPSPPQLNKFSQQAALGPHQPGGVGLIEDHRWPPTGSELRQHPQRLPHIGGPSAAGLYALADSTGQHQYSSPHGVMQRHEVGGVMRGGGRQQSHHPAVQAHHHGAYMEPSVGNAGKSESSGVRKRPRQPLPLDTFLEQQEADLVRQSLQQHIPRRAGPGAGGAHLAFSQSARVKNVLQQQNQRLLQAGVLTLDDIHTAATKQGLLQLPASSVGIHPSGLGGQALPRSAALPENSCASYPRTTHRHHQQSPARSTSVARSVQHFGRSQSVSFSTPSHPSPQLCSSLPPLLYNIPTPSTPTNVAPAPLPAASSGTTSQHSAPGSLLSFLVMDWPHLANVIDEKYPTTTMMPPPLADRDLVSTSPPSQRELSLSLPVPPLSSPSEPSLLTDFLNAQWEGAIPSSENLGMSKPGGSHCWTCHTGEAGALDCVCGLGLGEPDLQVSHTLSNSPFLDPAEYGRAPRESSWPGQGFTLPNGGSLPGNVLPGWSMGGD